MELKNLTNKEYQAFQQICHCNKNTLSKKLVEILRYKYKNVYYNNYYIYAPGDIPVAICAHMDTVFNQPPTNIYYDKDKNVIWSPEGLGADDRAGIWAILSILKSKYRPSIIFLMDEEIGGVGASKFVKDFDKPASELKYIIELDRQGKNDCVFYNCDNREFCNYIESFGFEFDLGSFTDISIICPVWKIAGVNLSVGYFREHSTSETLNVSYLLSTISRVKNMLNVINEAPYFIYIASKTMGRYSMAYGFEEYAKCSQCGQYFNEYELFNVKGLDSKEHLYCCDCVSDDNKIKWCKYCKDPYEYDEHYTDDDICPDCASKILEGLIRNEL